MPCGQVPVKYRVIKQIKGFTPMEYKLQMPQLNGLRIERGKHSIPVK
jgi:hypothetical protein